MGKTFVLIKPEAFDRREDIEKDITENNFSIVEKKELKWIWSQIRKTYSKENLKYYGSNRANTLMSFLIPYVITRKFGQDPPIEVLILSSEGDTIKDFVEICGPRDAMEYVKEEFKNTLRGKYGLGPEHSFSRTIEGRDCRFEFNGIHKSSREEEYREELAIYFPDLLS